MEITIYCIGKRKEEEINLKNIGKMVPLAAEDNFEIKEIQILALCSCYFKLSNRGNSIIQDVSYQGQMLVLAVRLALFVHDSYGKKY